MTVLGVDPGRQKTGLAVVDADGAAVPFRAVIETPTLAEAVADLVEKWPITHIALGDSTSSHAARAQLETLLAARGGDIALHMVDERNSTLEARALYFKANPPRGWRRFVPLSLQTPACPVDDFAAEVVARRLLAKERYSGA